MPKVSEIMSTDIQVIEPQESLRRAARLMKQLDVGALPVCDGQRLLGVVTDRDLAVRGLAEGLGPDEGCVSDVMSTAAVVAAPDEDTQDVMRLMSEHRVRRVPVIDAGRHVVGIVSLGDLATRQGERIDQTVRAVSEPGA